MSDLDVHRQDLDVHRPRQPLFWSVHMLPRKTGLDSKFPEVVDVPRVGLDRLDGVLDGVPV